MSILELQCVILLNHLDLKGVKTPFIFVSCYPSVHQCTLYCSNCTASVHKLAAGRKLATTHLNVINRQMCGCTGFKSGSYNKSYCNRPFKNDTGL